MTCRAFPHSDDRRSTYGLEEAECVGWLVDSLRRTTQNAAPTRTVPARTCAVTGAQLLFLLARFWYLWFCQLRLYQSDILWLVPLVAVVAVSPSATAYHTRGNV